VQRRHVTRKMSKDEKKHADSLDITLIETPIVLDALIFVVNENRGVKSLTVKQLQDIYMGKIDRWETIGGDRARLYPYIRDANSGSQELMESLVMKGLIRELLIYVLVQIEESPLAVKLCKKICDNLKCSSPLFLGN